MLANKGLQETVEQQNHAFADLWIQACNQTCRNSMAVDLLQMHMQTSNSLQLLKQAHWMKVLTLG